MSDRDFAAEIRNAADNAMQVDAEQLRQWAAEIERLREDLRVSLAEISAWRDDCWHPTDATRRRIIDARQAADARGLLIQPRREEASDE